MAKKSSNAENGFSLELSKDQLGQIIKSLSPFRTDSNIRMTITKNGSVYEAEELGNTAKITIDGGTDLLTDFHGTQIFLSKPVLAKIHDNMETVAMFNFVKNGDDWTDLVVEISGDSLNIGLPIYTKEINTEYKGTEERQEIGSELLATAIRRTDVAMVRNSPSQGAVVIGETLICGSKSAISKFSGVLKDGMEIKIAPAFKDTLMHLTKLGDKISIIKTDDNKVVFSTGNIEYKTFLVNDVVADPETVLNGSAVKFRAGIENIITACKRLAIPLDGDSPLTINVKGDSIELQVFDIQNRMSKSEIPLVGKKEGGEETISVSLDAFMGIISVMSPESEISFEKDATDLIIAIKVSDEKQVTVLASTVVA